MIKRRLWKWFGYISTGIVLICDVSSQTLHIPIGLIPWIFVASIFWFFLFITGFFNI